jgi:hypothetical protein
VKEAQVLLRRALEREAEAQRLLLCGEGDRAAEGFREVAELYRGSWEEAHEGAYGRLAGMVKAAILAGDAREQAAYVGDQIAEPGSPAAAWPLALAALVRAEDSRARVAAAVMKQGGAAFARTAEAVDAIAARDGRRYAGAVNAIVGDFERREEHLTGVAIADTAAVLERLAASRGIAARPRSPVLPNP